MNVEQGAVGLAQVETLTVDDGAAVAISAQKATLVNSRALVVMAPQAEVVDGRVGILLAREVNGPVTAVLDTRQAAVAGLAAGAAIGLLFWLGRRLRGRE
jgi:hypothetical protein